MIEFIGRQTDLVNNPDFSPTAFAKPKEGAPSLKTRRNLKDSKIKEERSAIIFKENASSVVEIIGLKSVRSLRVKTLRSEWTSFERSICALVASGRPMQTISLVCVEVNLTVGCVERNIRL